MTRTNLLLTTVTSSLLLLVSLPAAGQAHAAMACSQQDATTMSNVEDAVLGVLPSDGDDDAVAVSLGDISQQIPTIAPELVKCALQTLVADGKAIRYQNNTYLASMHHHY